MIHQASVCPLNNTIVRVYSAHQTFQTLVLFLEFGPCQIGRLFPSPKSVSTEFDGFNSHTCQRIGFAERKEQCATSIGIDLLNDFLPVIIIRCPIYYGFYRTVVWRSLWNDCTYSYGFSKLFGKNLDCRSSLRFNGVVYGYILRS